MLYTLSDTDGVQCTLPELDRRGGWGVLCEFMTEDKTLWDTEILEPCVSATDRVWRAASTQKSLEGSGLQIRVKLGQVNPSKMSPWG